MHHVAPQKRMVKTSYKIAKRTGFESKLVKHSFETGLVE
jgi:hypothetical protein